jgi:hypothetical protein
MLPSGNGVCTKPYRQRIRARKIFQHGHNTSANFQTHTNTLSKTIMALLSSLLMNHPVFELDPFAHHPLLFDVLSGKSSEVDDSLDLPLPGLEAKDVNVSVTQGQTDAYIEVSAKEFKGRYRYEKMFQEGVSRTRSDNA